MVRPESLSRYLSNEYQCYVVSIRVVKLPIYFHSDFGDKRIGLMLFHYTEVKAIEGTKRWDILHHFFNQWHKYSSYFPRGNLLPITIIMI
jgi:hypothetical protein